jgi:hypothetical protein
MEEQSLSSLPKDKRLLAKFESFRKRYDLAIKGWIKSHGHVEIPVMFDHNRVPHWINRSERRKLQKKYGKRLRLNAHNYR